MAIKVLPPERHKWSPENQKFLDSIWDIRKKKGPEYVDLALVRMLQGLQKEGVGPLSSEKLDSLDAAYRHIQTLRSSNQTNERMRGLPDPTWAQPLEKVYTATLDNELNNWYGPDADRMKNLPGMKALNLKKKIPIYRSRMLPPLEDAGGAYLPGSGKVTMNENIYGPLGYYEPVFAHELGHATMDMAGDIGASHLFYDWNQPGKSDSSEHLGPGMTRYLAGKNVGHTPAEFSAFLLEFVRANKGTHPILHSEGLEAGVDNLVQQMRRAKGPDGGMFKTMADWIEANPDLKYDVMKFFQKYATNNVVEDGGGFVVRDAEQA